MARLASYFGQHNGDLQIYIGIFQIGSGTFKSFGDFAAEFAGSYTVAGQEGKFAIAIKITDLDPASSSGQCQLTLNGKTDNKATFAVHGQKLTITTQLNDTPLDVYVSQGGTQVDRISGHNIWIGNWA